MTEKIILRGCRQNNLKNITVSLPKNAIVAITGVSGSGKSSLAFDTLFAEGQRRFLEYLSPRARQLIKQLPRPEIDSAEGLSPTLAVRQNHRLYSANSVASQTDIYDFLTLLYARIAEQYSPTTGEKLTRFTRQEIVEAILNYPKDTRLQLLAPISFQEEAADAFKRLQKMGFLRFRVNGVVFEEDIPADITSLEVVVDRIIIKENQRERIADSVETALDLSRGILKVLEGSKEKVTHFTELYLSLDTYTTFDPMQPADFNYLSKGACPTCSGQGGEYLFNEKVWRFKQKPIIDQVFNFLQWLKERHKTLWREFHPLDSSKEDLQNSPSELLAELKKGAIWSTIQAIIKDDLATRKADSCFYDQEYTVWKICPQCRGDRLKPEALACKIQGKNIADICKMEIDQLLCEIKNWTFEQTKQQIAEEIIPQVLSRLSFLQKAGLGYLQLNRSIKTLSTGESQRILLASQVGAKLSGITYVLDEPSRGLHQEDVGYLIAIFDSLRSHGNHLFLIEHEPLLIAKADHILEIGALSGVQGGEVTFAGSYSSLLSSDSITGRWLSGREKIDRSYRGKAKAYLQVCRANLHNLKEVSLNLPLGLLVGVCGVSGSGKSTLAMEAIADDLRKKRPNFISNPELVCRLQTVDQPPAGLSSRSTVATYTGLMKPLRELFAQTKLARARGYSVSRFSTYKKGGRCESCQGVGEMQIGMEFMADLSTLCQVCQGKRYNFETLQVLWEGLSIADVLALSVSDALKQFKNIPSISHYLQLMQEVGLEYLSLGQSFRTLSGGETQRLKLLSELARSSPVPTLYILDEPCAGLHYSDIYRLSLVLQRLVARGDSVVIVEHNLLLLEQCDWLIEMGPKGGAKGGEVIFEGSCAKLKKADTPTGRAFSRWIR